MRLWALFTILVLSTHSSKQRFVLEDTETICKLPENQGNCRGLLKRWFFNKKTKTCELFIYGGCGGNKNNFKSKLQCLKTCSYYGPCSLPKVQGPCYTLSQRWFYNQKTETCETFEYGGCGGNANNFDTRIECLWMCKDRDLCFLSKDPGSCQDKITRWFYNWENNNCEPFAYGGCEGNENNFHCKSECSWLCKLD